MIYLLAFLQTCLYSLRLHSAAGHKSAVVPSCLHLITADALGGASVWCRIQVASPSSVAAKHVLACCIPIVCSRAVITPAQALLTQHLSLLLRSPLDACVRAVRGDDACSQCYHLVPFAEVCVALIVFDAFPVV